MNSNSLYRNGSFNLQFIFGAIALAMIAVSIYLTNHFYQVVFPQGLSAASALCDINSFFTCDAATHSPFSNIAGIPISLGGLLMGAFLLAGFFFKSEEIEKTNLLLLWINIVGCAVLFIYSLVALGTLCPMCTLYYVLSAAALFLLARNSSAPALDVKVAGAYVVIALVAGGIFYSVSSGKREQVARIAPSLINQFNALPNLGKPAVDSPYRLASATENFIDAPLQVTMFSDFQCPACRMLSDVMHTVVKTYKGKINAQYFFYPLDPACNDKMQSALHPHACRAAYLSVCLKDKFAQVHDDIFANQDKLSTEWIDNYARRENVLDCVNAPETKAQVVALMKEAEPFGVQSTPTLLINGKKIEGMLPPNNMNIIFDEILKNAKR